MVPSIVSIFVIFLAINVCFTSSEHPKTDQVSKISRVTPSTGQPDITTRGPHTHDEHPADDPDHSDHVHEEELKAAQPSDDEHDHPGHDHSETGHDHSEDHPEVVEDPEKTKLSLPVEDPKKEEEVEKVGEYKGSRARRGLWRRRLD